jgi:spore maturation protein SpmB
LVGMLALCLKQGIRWWDRTILSWILGLGGVLGGLALLFAQLNEAQVSHYSALISNLLLISLITGFIAAGAYKRINVYETFIEGAKEGFKTAVMIIPYLIAILVAVALFRASGAMSLLTQGLQTLFMRLGFDTQFVEALPTAFMKPLTGSGARGMMVDAMQTHGADSFVGRLVSIIQGSTDTTFYILAVYFGSVGIKNSRYAAGYGLLADAAGILAAIGFTYLFFGR